MVISYQIVVVAKMKFEVICYFMMTWSLPLFYLMSVPSI